MQESSGTLLYRQSEFGLEVLLVHPSGNYNRKAPWSIPKGLPSPSETVLEDTARRETLEETGIQPDALISLGSIVYSKGRKRVHCFAGPAPVDAKPHTATWEVDQARFVPLIEARVIIHPDQRTLLDRLIENLGT